MDKATSDNEHLTLCLRRAEEQLVRRDEQVRSEGFTEPIEPTFTSGGLPWSWAPRLLVSSLMILLVRFRRISRKNSKWNRRQPPRCYLPTQPQHSAHTTERNSCPTSAVSWCLAFLHFPRCLVPLTFPSSLHSLSFLQPRRARMTRNA